MATSMRSQKPASASSTELSTTSYTMWCRPEPSSVSPMYMPGRLRTASRPFRTLIASASYRWDPLAFFAGAALMSVDCPSEEICVLGGYSNMGMKAREKKADGQQNRQILSVCYVDVWGSA